MIPWWIPGAVLCISLVMTMALRRYALARRMIDVPNARSSHSIPTPRGGGVAIVLSFLIGLAMFAGLAGVPRSLIWALCGAGGIVAVVGFLDDHGHVAARWRLVAHLCGAVWALAWLGGAPPLYILGEHFELGWLGFGLAAIYLVWMLNLYNFMDGIDGLASVEALCVCFGGAILHLLAGQEIMVGILLLLGGAVVGFLYWNFPPAKIFMGDAGSGFLGIMLGVLSLQAAWSTPAFLWSWLILLAVFVTDATVTLLRRLVRGDRIYEAHRTHAYQHASRSCGRHLPVTLGVAAINLFWLMPIAIWVGHGRLDGLLGMAFAYFPLVVLALRFRSGVPEAA